MARGFESKSVEQQQAEMLDRRLPSGPRLTTEQQERKRKRDGLLLSRTRLTRQLESSESPRHRQQLADGIAELDRQLSCFE